MSMSERFDKLFERMKLEFKKQTMELTYSLTTNLSIKLEAKIKPLKLENKALKTEIEYLEKTIESLERDSKRNNIILFGFEEKETCVNELLEAVRKKIRDDLGILILAIDINNVYRVGKRNKESSKPRPVVITFVHKWKRNEVLRNKKKFRNVFVSEDFPKIVVEKRRLWQAELKEERKKGNIAYLVYDKLLVKPGRGQNMKNEEIKDENAEDLSELLDSIEQCEQEEEDKKPRQRRAKAMIRKNKSFSDGEKENNEKNKPRGRATVVKTKKNKSSDEESEEERVVEKFRRRATAINKKRASSLNGDLDEEYDEKPKPRAKKNTNKKDSFSDEENEEGEKEKPRTTAAAYVPQKRKMNY